MEQDKKLT